MSCAETTSMLLYSMHSYVANQIMQPCRQRNGGYSIRGVALLEGCRASGLGHQLTVPAPLPWQTSYLHSSPAPFLLMMASTVCLALRWCHTCLHLRVQPSSVLVRYVLFFPSPFPKLGLLLGPKHTYPPPDPKPPASRCRKYQRSVDQ